MATNAKILLLRVQSIALGRVPSSSIISKWSPYVRFAIEGSSKFSKTKVCKGCRDKKTLSFDENFVLEAPEGRKYLVVQLMNGKGDAGSDKVLGEVVIDYSIIMTPNAQPQDKFVLSRKGSTLGTIHLSIRVATAPSIPPPAPLHEPLPPRSSIEPVFNISNSVSVAEGLTSPSVSSFQPSPASSADFSLPSDYSASYISHQPWPTLATATAKYQSSALQMLMPPPAAVLSYPPPPHAAPVISVENPKTHHVFVPTFDPRVGGFVKMGPGQLTDQARQPREHFTTFSTLAADPPTGTFPKSPVPLDLNALSDEGASIGSAFVQLRSSSLQLMSPKALRPQHRSSSLPVTLSKEEPAVILKDEPQALVQDAQFEVAVDKMRAHLSVLFEELTALQFSSDRKRRVAAGVVEDCTEIWCLAIQQQQPSSQDIRDRRIARSVVRKSTFIIKQTANDVCVALAGLPLQSSDDGESEINESFSNSARLDNSSPEEGTSTSAFETQLLTARDTHRIIKTSARVLSNPQASVADKCKAVEFVALRSRRGIGMHSLLKREQIYELLINLLAHPNVHCRETASKALWLLCADPVCCFGIKSAGGVQPLCALLSCKMESIQRNVAGALAFLCMNDSTRQMCSEPDVISPLVQMLSSPNTEVQENAACTLSILTQAARSKQLCRLNGGVPALLNLTNNGTKKAKEYSLETLRHIHGGSLPTSHRLDGFLTLPTPSVTAPPSNAIAPFLACMH